VSLHLLAGTAIRTDARTGMATKKLSLKAQFLVDGQVAISLIYVSAKKFGRRSFRTQKIISFSSPAASYETIHFTCLKRSIAML
jgi:hypothetical protein